MHHNAGAWHDPTTPTFVPMYRYAQGRRFFISLGMVHNRIEDGKSTMESHEVLSNALRNQPRIGRAILPVNDRFDGTERCAEGAAGFQTL